MELEMPVSDSSSVWICLAEHGDGCYPSQDRISNGAVPAHHHSTFLRRTSQRMLIQYECALVKTQGSDEYHSDCSARRADLLVQTLA